MAWSRKPSPLDGKYTFVTPGGNVRDRRTVYNPGSRDLIRFDLDAMDRDQLRAFIGSWRKKEIINNWARQLFPLRPVHYPIAARTLYKMAILKLAGKMVRYEFLYQKLPPYAQFRREFNIAACLSGK